MGGIANLPLGASYLEGDANLDGAVDVSDFNLWNQNQFTANAAWSAGDFNADGNVDVSDFNIWNSNTFQTAGDSLFAVPEPDTAVLILLAGFGSLCLVRRTRS